MGTLFTEQGIQIYRSFNTQKLWIRSRWRCHYRFFGTLLRPLFQAPLHRNLYKELADAYLINVRVAL